MMAVINSTECSLKKCIRLVQGIVLLLLLVGANGAPDREIQTCETVKGDISARGLPDAMVPDKPGNGTCGPDSCCSLDLEVKMLENVRNHLDRFLKDSINKVVSLIDVRAKKLDGFFRDMMNNSKHGFHEMFVRTYGKIYLQNSDVFADFFTELETYYRKGSVRLTETMDTFFGILYQRMFTVINSQYVFDERYLECVSEHMIEMKPFGDVPYKLSMQLKRSFVATRAYQKSLTIGAEVVTRMLELRLEESCGRDLMKMRFCGVCKSRNGVGPCTDYCTDVLEACLRNHVLFSPEWDNFIDALDKVADRLIGPFNIEMVVEPLNIKISEAIMNFQESGTEVSKKIFSLCGKPSFSRTKRKAKKPKASEEEVDPNPMYEIKYEPIKMHGRKKKTKKIDEEEDNIPTLEKHIKEIKMKVKETRQFWLQLPYQYCNNPAIAAPPSENGRCWNGTDVGTFNRTRNNATENGRSALVNEQIYALQVLTDKLRKAHQGDEVDIVDDADEELDGSGSGSGDGGGVIDEDEEEDIKTSTNANGPDIGPEDNDDDDEDGDEDIVVEPEKVPQPPQPPPPPAVTTSTRPPEVIHASGAPSMSLSQALAQYLIPIVLVWFGGAISDLL